MAYGVWSRHEPPPRGPPRALPGTLNINGIKGSPAYLLAPDVEAAIPLWETENANLAANDQKKEKARQALAQAEADEITIMRHWGLRRLGVLHAVNVYCDGSKEKVQSFTLPRIQRKKLPPATVPTKLGAAKSKKPTSAVVAWGRTKGNHGYMVQHATDLNDPATLSAPIMCKRARFALPEQTLGATIHFRVLALDPSLPGGQSDYTAWVAVTVGAQ